MSESLRSEEDELLELEEKYLISCPLKAEGRVNLNDVTKDLVEVDDSIFAWKWSFDAWARMFYITNL